MPESFDELRGRLGSTPFYGLLGIELVSAGEGRAEVGLTLGDELLNVQGIAHGGVLATLADSACGLAVRTALGPGRRHVTIQLSIQYLLPATAGRVVASGRALRVGEQIAYAEADVFDEQDRLLARAASTIGVMRERTDS
jgi:uncharacterized protein (TIGR00369 family)